LRSTLPRASRRSTPCWPAAGSLSGAKIVSMPAIGRGLVQRGQQLEVGGAGVYRRGQRHDVEQRAVDVEEEGPVSSEGRHG
jgi:hypothetical protein